MSTLARKQVFSQTDFSLGMRPNSMAPTSGTQPFRSADTIVNLDLFDGFMAIRPGYHTAANITGAVASRVNTNSAAILFIHRAKGFYDADGIVSGGSSYDAGWYVMHSTVMQYATNLSVIHAGTTVAGYSVITSNGVRVPRTSIDVGPWTFVSQFPYGPEGRISTSNAATWGIAVASTPNVTAVTAVSSLVAGVYAYRSVQVDTTVSFGSTTPNLQSWGNPSSTVSVTITSSETPRVSLFGFTHINIDTFRLYRTLVGGSTYFFHSTRASSTAFTDTVADSALGVEVETDNGYAPATVQTYDRQTEQWERDFLNMTANSQVEHVGRMWIATVSGLSGTPSGGDNVVYYSKPNSTTRLGLEQFDGSETGRYIAVGNPDPVIDLVVWNERLFALKQCELWEITGKVEPFGTRFITEGQGPTYPGSVATFPEGIYYTNHLGTHLFNGVSVTNLWDQFGMLPGILGDFSKNIIGIPDSTENLNREGFGFSWRDRYYYASSYHNVDLFPHLWVYHRGQRGFTMYDFVPMVARAVEPNSLYAKALVFGTDDGWVYMMEEDYGDGVNTMRDVRNSINEFTSTTRLATITTHEIVSPNESIDKWFYETRWNVARLDATDTLRLETRINRDTAATFDRTETIVADESDNFSSISGVRTLAARNFIWDHKGFGSVIQHRLTIQSGNLGIVKGYDMTLTPSRHFRKR